MDYLNKLKIRTETVTHCPKLIFYPIQIWQVFNNISGLLMLNTSDISKEKRKLSGVLLENTI